MNPRDYIRAIMTDKNITQKELSAKLGIQQGTLNKTLTSDNKGLLFSKFKEILNALDYEIKVVKKGVS